MAPILFCIQLLVTFWPVTVLGFLALTALNVWQMVDDRQANVVSIIWIVYFLFMSRFFLRIPPEVRKAVWAQFLDKNVTCWKPGISLQVIRTSDSTSDIIVDESFIPSGSNELSLVRSRYHFRRSLDLTLSEALSGDVYDHQDNFDAPQYFLHGSGAESVADFDEVWTSHASVTSWAAWYSYPEALPAFGLGIPLTGEETTVGYVHLLRTTEPLANDQVSVLCNPCAAFVPACMGKTKVVARRSYWTKFLFGNFPAGKPDAFIFMGNVIQDTGLRTVHRFRIVARNPGRA